MEIPKDATSLYQKEIPVRYSKSQSALDSPHSSHNVRSHSDTETNSSPPLSVFMRTNP